MLSDPETRPLLLKSILGEARPAGANDPPAEDVSAGTFGGSGGGGQYIFLANGATTTPLTVKGAASQSVPLQDWKNSAGDVLATVQGDGKVGVGTDAPQTKAHVTVPDSNTVVWALTLQNPGCHGDDAQGVGIKLKLSDYSSSDETSKWAGVAAVGNVGQGWSINVGVAFYVRNEGADPYEAGRFDSLGRLGLGTTTPTQKLDVNGAIAIAGTAIVSIGRVLSNVTADAAIIASGTLDDGRLPPSMSGKTFSGNVLPSSTGLDLGSGAQRWDVFGANGDFTGNIGIGASPPAEKLDVAGKIRASGDHPILIDPSAGGILLPVEPPGDMYGATKQYVDNKVAGIFNVKEFGATGDGTTDDTDAIQDAIDAAAVAGGVVFFPPGTYLIGNLTGASNIHLRGAGAGATTLLYNGATVQEGDTYHCYMIRFLGGQSHFSIRDITWNYHDVTFSNSLHQNIAPIVVAPDGCHEFDLSDCALTHLSTAGYDAQRQAYIRTYGIIVVAVQDFRIERNLIDFPTPTKYENQAILVSQGNEESPPVLNGVINANHCQRSGMIVGGFYLKITNNIIHDFRWGSGITVGPDSRTYGLDIIGNTVCNGTGLDDSGTWCAGIENWAQQSVISGNVCHGNCGNGIANGGLRCTVTNNICYNNGVFPVPPWSTPKTVSIGDLVLPTTPNGHKYICTAGGAVDEEEEPDWPTDPGETVQDGSAVWKEHGADTGVGALPLWSTPKTVSVRDVVLPATPHANGHKYVCTTGGAVGGTEPAWPTDPGATVQDGSAVWKEHGPYPSPDVYGIAMPYAGPDYNSTGSVYAGNRCFDTHDGTNKTQKYGIGDESNSCTDVTIGINNLSGNAVAELDIKGSDYTLVTTSGGNVGIGKADPGETLDVAGTIRASGAADFSSLKIGATEVITSGHVLQNVALNPASLQIGGTEVISEQLELHSVSADAGIINSGSFQPARIPNLSASKITNDEFDPARIPNLSGGKITSGSISVPGGVSGGNLAVGGTEVVTAGRNVGNVVNINNSGYVHSGGVGNFDDGVQVDSGTVITSGRQMIHRHYHQAQEPTLANQEIAQWTDGSGYVWLIARDQYGDQRKVQIT
jgi:hypothetical protein